MTNPTEDKADISVIIPAYNEECFIGDTIDALNLNLKNFNHEVIVVDNGSTDATRQISREKGASVILKEKGTIASLRNEGVAHASGKLLIFIDADVTVTPEWGRHLQKNYKRYVSEKLISGSRCLPVNEEYWLNKYWFALMPNKNAAYINSGHLICAKQLFKEINGFSEHLVTAEDYDFCIKAKRNGASISPDSNLKVFHYGYPKSAREFIARERWHGRQDYLTLKSAIESKVAALVMFNALVALVCIVGTIFINPLFVLIYIVFACIFLPTLSLWKFRNNPKPHFLIRTSAVFALYIIGRTLALFDRFTSTNYKKRQRGA